MATIYSKQYNDAYVLKPSAKIAPGDVNGYQLHKYFEFVITAAPTAADVLKLCRLPKGARVLDLEIAFPDLGTAGSLNIGWAASSELGDDGVVLEAANAVGFMAAVDVNTAAAIVNMSDVAGAYTAGYLKDFAAEVDVQIDIATAWTATSGVIKGYITFVQI